MREAVVESARSWIGTPYHHMAKVKGSGVDCGQLVLCSFEEAGLPGLEDPGTYTRDWHLHRGEERYLSVVERYLVPDDKNPGDLSSFDRINQDPLFHLGPGSVLVWKVGRTYSHGGIITKWPFFIHASIQAMMVEEVSLLRCAYVSTRPMMVYTSEAYK